MHAFPHQEDFSEKGETVATYHGLSRHEFFMASLLSNPALFKAAWEKDYSYGGGNPDAWMAKRASEIANEADEICKQRRMK